MWGEHQGSSGWPLECHQTVHSRDPVIILGLSPIGLQHEAKISNLKTAVLTEGGVGSTLQDACGLTGISGLCLGPEHPLMQCVQPPGAPP